MVRFPLYSSADRPPRHQEAFKYNNVAISEEIEPIFAYPEAFVHPLRGKTILVNSYFTLIKNGGAVRISSFTV